MFNDFDATELDQEPIVEIDALPTLEIYSLRDPGNNVETQNKILSILARPENAERYFDIHIASIDDEELYDFMSNHFRHKNNPFQFDYIGSTRKITNNIAHKLSIQEKAHYATSGINSFLDNPKAKDIVIVTWGSDLIAYGLLLEYSKNLNADFTFYTTEKAQEIIPEAQKASAVLSMGRWAKNYFLPAVFNIHGYKTIYSECFDKKGQIFLNKIVGLSYVGDFQEIPYNNNTRWIKRYKIKREELIRKKWDHHKPKSNKGQ